MLIGTTTSAQTGLRKATSMVHRAAQEIAELNTSSSTSAKAAAANPSKIETTLQDRPDPVDATITMKLGQVMYRANLEVIKSVDEMRGKAADLIV